MNISAVISVSRKMGYDNELTCGPREPGLSWPAPACPSKWGSLPGSPSRGLVCVSECAPALQLLVCVRWGDSLAPVETSRQGPPGSIPPSLMAWHSVLFSSSLAMMAGASTVSPPPSHPFNAQLGGQEGEPGLPLGRVPQSL